MRWVLRFITLATLLVAVASPSARAGDAPADIRRLLAPVPPGVRGMVVMHDPVALRERLLASEPSFALSRLGLLGSFDRPWQALASALDRTSAQLVDDLTGGGLALIATELPPVPGAAASGSTMGWSALGLVSEETARRVRERLRAVPAMLVQGQPVYAIEDGSLWLLIRPLAAPISGRSHALVLTLPDGGESRVEPLARLLSPREAHQQDAGPWSMLSTLLAPVAPQAAPEAPDAAVLSSADVSVIWQVQEPEPLWIGAVASVQADRWRMMAVSTAMADLPEPLSDAGLIDRVAAAHSQAALLMHVRSEMTLAGVISPGESFSMISRTPAGKPLVAHAAACASLADAAASLDERAATMRSMLAAGQADKDKPLAALLPQVDATTWRQAPLNLRAGSPLRAVFGPFPSMAWRAFPAHGGAAWALWVLDPDGVGDVGESIAAPLVAAPVTGVRPYVARLRLQPRTLRDALPPVFTLPLMDVGVVHAVDADMWLEPAAEPALRRLRVRAEIRFGKP